MMIQSRGFGAAENQILKLFRYKLKNVVMENNNPKKQVLIVEDNEDNSLLAEKVLNYYGFKTFIAADGQKALQYCETHQPDLILMDISLPDMNGLEVAHRLRSKDHLTHVPIIALTAHNLKTIQADLNDFLVKPFLPNDLISIVRRYLP